MFWVSLRGVPAQITESNFLVFSKEDIITTLSLGQGIYTVVRSRTGSH